MFHFYSWFRISMRPIMIRNYRKIPTNSFQKGFSTNKVALLSPIKSFLFQWDLVFVLARCWQEQKCLRLLWESFIGLKSFRIQIQTNFQIQKKQLQGWRLFHCVLNLLLRKSITFVNIDLYLYYFSEFFLIPIGFGF